MNKASHQPSPTQQQPLRRAAATREEINRDITRRAQADYEMRSVICRRQNQPLPDFAQCLQLAQAHWDHYQYQRPIGTARQSGFQRTRVVAPAILAQNLRARLGGNNSNSNLTQNLPRPQSLYLQAQSSDRGNATNTTGLIIKNSSNRSNFIIHPLHHTQQEHNQPRPTAIQSTNVVGNIPPAISPPTGNEAEVEGASNAAEALLNASFSSEEDSQEAIRRLQAYRGDLPLQLLSIWNNGDQLPVIDLADLDQHIPEMPKVQMIDVGIDPIFEIQHQQSRPAMMTKVNSLKSIKILVERGCDPIEELLMHHVKPKMTDAPCDPVENELMSKFTASSQTDSINNNVRVKLLTGTVRKAAEFGKDESDSLKMSSECNQIMQKFRSQDINAKSVAALVEVASDPLRDAKFRNDAGGRKNAEWCPFGHVQSSMEPEEIVDASEKVENAETEVTFADVEKQAKAASETLRKNSPTQRRITRSQAKAAEQKEAHNMPTMNANVQFDRIAAKTVPHPRSSKRKVDHVIDGTKETGTNQKSLSASLRHVTRNGDKQQCKSIDASLADGGIRVPVLKTTQILAKGHEQHNQKRKYTLEEKLTAIRKIETKFGGNLREGERNLLIHNSVLWRWMKKKKQLLKMKNTQARIKQKVFSRARANRQAVCKPKSTTKQQPKPVLNHRQRRITPSLEQQAPAAEATELNSEAAGMGGSLGIGAQEKFKELPRQDLMRTQLLPPAANRLNPSNLMPIESSAGSLVEEALLPTQKEPTTVYPKKAWTPDTEEKKRVSVKSDDMKRKRQRKNQLNSTGESNVIDFDTHSDTHSDATNSQFNCCSKKPRVGESKMMRMGRAITKSASQSAKRFEEKILRNVGSAKVSKKCDATFPWAAGRVGTGKSRKVSPHTVSL